MMYFLLALVSYLFMYAASQSDITKCLESNTHKPHPSIESELHGEVRYIASFLFSPQD